MSESEDEKTVEELRQGATRWLPSILEALYDIGLSADNKPGDRVQALKLLKEFVEGADEKATKSILKLGPSVARKLARMSVEKDQKPQKEPHENGNVFPSEEKG